MQPSRRRPTTGNRVASGGYRQHEEHDRRSVQSAPNRWTFEDSSYDPRHGAGKHNRHHRRERTRADSFSVADNQRHDQRQRENRQRKLESLRINDEPCQWQVEEHAVTRARPRQRLGAESPRHRKHLGPVMLEAPRIQVSDVVHARMVALDAVGKSEVECGKAEHRKLGEIGVVRQRAIDRRVDRSGRGVTCIAQRSGGIEVTRARLEHERAARGTARLEVENYSDVLRPRVLAHECGRSEKPRFLAVGEQGDDVVNQWLLARAQRPQTLEHRGGSRGVVRSRRPGLHSVVVHHHEHGLGIRTTARNAGENVLNSPRVLVARPDSRRPLDLRAQSKRRELADDVIAHAVVIRGAHRMRPLRHLLDVRHRALSGEYGVGRRSRNGARRPRDP